MAPFCTNKVFIREGPKRNKINSESVMEINERNIKMWSTIGPRATLGIAALDLAKKMKT